MQSVEQVALPVMQFEIALLLGQSLSAAQSHL